MKMNRRQTIKVLGGSIPALMLPEIFSLAEAGAVRRTSMGIVTYAFGIHQKHAWGGRHPNLSPALALLEESHRLGAGGIMADLSSKNAPEANEIRARAERYGMYVEASIMPPKSQDDTERFEADIQAAQAAGATLARTVILPGRRYEQFKSLQEFREYEQAGLQSLQWAVPVLARRKFRLAVENHKDQRIAEKLETLKKVGSEWIGLCLDLGNSFTLLESPLETVQAYAPYAFTVHIKDHAVRENATGFLFADVAMGRGMLDLPQMVGILRQANPRIRFGLEVITRDALEVPVFTDAFWRTLPNVPAIDLARTMQVVKAKSCPEPFPPVSQLPVEEQLKLELGNVCQSIAYAADRLGLQA